MSESQFLERFFFLISLIVFVTQWANSWANINFWFIINYQAVWRVVVLC